MPRTLPLLLLIFGCIIINTSAQYFAISTNSQSPDQYNVNSFSSSDQLPVPNGFDASSNQQLISTNFPTTDNAVSSSSATASVPPGLIPNAFTRAVLAIPSIQRFLNIQIPRFQGADLLFKVAYKELQALGHPASATVANVLAQNLSGLDVFTIPLYFHIKGKQLEKFLTVEGIAITDNLVQSYADFTEQSLQSSILDSNEALLSAIITGHINFIQSLGYSFVEEAYILALVFSEETIIAIDASQPNTL